MQLSICCAPNRWNRYYVIKIFPFSNNFYSSAFKFSVQLQIQQTLNGIDRRLENLEGKFNKYEPIFDKAGLTYELAMRREVRELRGFPYARSFRVENLAGLARISSPKEIDNDLMSVHYWNSHVRSSSKAHKSTSKKIFFYPTDENH